jgi:hypothetical protein
MTHHNFMLADVATISCAFLWYTLFLFVPGYVVAFGLNLLEFRRQPLLLQCAAAVAVSCSLSPVLAYLLWTMFSVVAVWIVFGGLWAGFLFLTTRRLVRQGRSFSLRMNKFSWVLVGVSVGWILLALFSLVDLQMHGRLYRSVADYDHCVRTAIASAIARFGLPARTPFFYPGQPVPLRSHYFWLVPSALVQLIGHGSVTAREAMLAGSMWCGLALPATVCIYLRFFFRKGNAGSEPSAGEQSVAGGDASAPVWLRKSALACALIAVTGLDILPTIYIFFRRHIAYADMEWWNEQVTSWFDSMIWTPHHVAALLAALTGFLIIFRGTSGNSRRNVALALIAGLAFACSVGTSVYVGFTFCLFAVVWCIVLAFRRLWRELQIFVLAGVVAAVCLLPFLSGASSHAGGGGFLQLTVRSFFPVDAFLERHALVQPWIAHVAHLLFLPLNYLLEFGFFFLVGVWRLQRYIRNPRHRTLAETCALTMFASGLLVSMFVRSSVITSNDLGWRSALLPQFICLLWAPDLLWAWFSTKRFSGKRLSRNRSFAGPWLRGMAYAFLALGFLGSIYQIAMLRFYSPLLDGGELSPTSFQDFHWGEMSYAMRETYEWLRKNTSGAAIEQHNPSYGYDDPYWGLYGDRQVVANNIGCDLAMGGDSAQCGLLVWSLFAIYQNPGIETSKVDHLCRKLKVDMLIVKRTDDLWKNPNSWIWQKSPAFANDYARVFSCR